MGVAVLAAVLFWVFWPGKGSPNQAGQTAPASGNAAQSASGTLVHLYFSDSQGSRLVSDDRMMTSDPDPTRYCRAIMEALLAGPLQQGIRCIPEGTSLLSVFVGPQKTAYIDLTRQVRDGQPGGVMAEAQTVYSIVNTITLNVEGVEAVKILIEGQESPTLAGHVDLKQPLQADTRIIGP